jgi:predicted RNase H-like HicB family nuclease
MIMQSILNATEVRANFGGFIDTVVRDKPQVVKRNRDVIASFSIPHVLELLSFCELSMEFEEENGHYVGSLEQIDDIVGEGSTLDELRTNLAIQLVEYAQDYYADFKRYYSTPNRRTHFPYVILVNVQNNLEGVVKLIRG